jgi:hypothetical protein
MQTQQEAGDLAVQLVIRRAVGVIDPLGGLGFPCE